MIWNLIFYVLGFVMGLFFPAAYLWWNGRDVA